MKVLILIFVFISNCSIAQSNRTFLDKFLHGDVLKAENIIDEYNSYDFSSIWLKAKNLNVLGIIGEDHQRLKIKLIEAIKSKENPNEYIVKGKSSVKGNVCDFQGKITLLKIQEVNKLHFGVDNEYENKGIKSQGVLFANYQFYESSEQNHSGVFKGDLYSRWYLNNKDYIEYDDIRLASDNYMNNSFIGTWEKYNSKLVKKCNWGDYRIPKTNNDFDIGAGEFSPSDKYLNYGWENRRKAMIGDNIAINEEEKEWWK